MKPIEGGVASRVMRRLPAIAALLLLLLFTGCKKATAEDAQMDPSMMLGALGPIIGLAIVPFFVFGGYITLLFLSFFDRREGRLGKNDMQLGTKFVLWGFILAGISMILGGANTLVTYVLSGFKGGFDPIKGVLSSVITGVVVAGGVGLMFVPRTNNSEEPQIERWAMGLLAVIPTLIAIFSLNDLIYSVFKGAGWRTDIAPSLSRLVVFGAAGGFAVMRHGGLSGWTAPVKPTMPSMPGGFPGAGGGQAGGGYPPQQGGGYPPQGGGYPPQGGGYPPQGGGYPQGGGGYPQGGGGGYPPQGGGYGR